MQKRLRVYIFSLFVCIFFTAFFADTTFATHEKGYHKPIEANHKLLPPFTFHSWDVDIQVNENNTILVKETWRGEFLKNKHGLYRHIPFIYDMEHSLSGIVGKGRFLSYIDILSVKKRGSTKDTPQKKKMAQKLLLLGIRMHMFLVLLSMSLFTVFRIHFYFTKQKMNSIGILLVPIGKVQFRK